MEKLKLDTGMRTYKIDGGGVLRFNPADPNVYARFLEAADKLAELEKDLAERAEKLESDEEGLRLLVQADQETKKILTWVFGADNDFNEILGGVNLLAVGSNGERVIENFFAAMEPILIAGAEDCARQQTQAAVARAKARRAGR